MAQIILIIGWLFLFCTTPGVLNGFGGLRRSGAVKEYATDGHGCTRIENTKAYPCASVSIRGSKSERLPIPRSVTHLTYCAEVPVPMARAKRVRNAWPTFGKPSPSSWIIDARTRFGPCLLTQRRNFLLSDEA